MLLVYTKNNGVVVDNQGINSQHPNGIVDYTNIIRHIVARLGGTESDYGVLRLHDIEGVEIVNKTFTHQYTIQDGEVVFGDIRPPEPEPLPEPTETEMLMDYLVDVDYRVTMIELGL